MMTHVDAFSTLLSKHKNAICVLLSQKCSLIEKARKNYVSVAGPGVELTRFECMPPYVVCCVSDMVRWHHFIDDIMII